jgi:D-glycero-alpha-D-manno-heptose 1-phosphate guanylyltransferase
VEAIILAGGFGTRLQSVVNDVPKSMAPVNNRPFLDYLLNYLTGQGVSKVIISAGYKYEAIQSHFGDRYHHLPITYAVESEPLGTGGGIMNAMKVAESDDVFVLNGDSMFRLGLPSLANVHAQKKAMITIALKYMEDCSRYGAVILDEQNRIKGFMEKGTDAGAGYINAGVYLIRKEFMLSKGFPEKFSMEKDCFEKMWPSEAFYGYPSRGYFLDIGIPEDYLKAQDQFRFYED